MGQQLDQAQQRQEDMGDARMMFETAVDEIIVEIQQRKDCIEEHIDERRKDMTKLLEAVSGLRSKMSSSASTGLSAAEVAESVAMSVQSIEKRVDIRYVEIQRQLSVLGKTADAINS